MKTPYMCLKCGRMFSTPQEMKSCDHKKEQVSEEEKSAETKTKKTKGA